MEFQIDPPAGCRSTGNWPSSSARPSPADGSSPRTACPRSATSRALLVINPNTVARVYTELEREGILNTRPGLGVFVARPKAELTRKVRKERLEELVDHFLTEAVHLGFCREVLAWSPPGEAVPVANATKRVIGSHLTPALSHPAGRPAERGFNRRTSHARHDRYAPPDEILRSPPRGRFARSARRRKARSTACWAATAPANRPLIKMLLGMVHPDYGRAEVFGEDALQLRPETRARIAYLAEGHPLYRWMTRRRGGALHPRVLSQLERAAWWSRSSIISSFRRGPRSGGSPTASGPRSRWPWPWPPIPNC